MARRKKHHRKHHRRSRGIGGFKLNKGTLLTFAALGAGSLLARYANKKLPEVVGGFSGSLGSFAKYATPAALIALAMIVKKMAKGGQFVTLATNQAIGDAIADAFASAFPNVITGLGLESPLQGDMWRLAEPNVAVPYPSALQGIPEGGSTIYDPSNYKEYAY